MNKVEAEINSKAIKNNEFDNEEFSVESVSEIYEERKNFSSYMEDEDRSEEPEDTTTCIHVPLPTPLQLFEGGINMDQIQDISRPELSPVIETVKTHIPIAQKKEHTEITVRCMSEGVFDGLEIKINFFQTDPISFHISFTGNEKAIEILSKETNSIKTQLQKTFTDYRFHIHTPYLSEDHYQKKTIKIKKSNLTKESRSIFSKITSDSKK